jgi:hypothetical protein
MEEQEDLRFEILNLKWPNPSLGGLAVCDFRFQISNSSMSDLPPLPTEPRPGRYRHYKGHEYRVVGLARHSETLEVLVVYEALYGERGRWVRPAAMFTEAVESAGRLVPRFERVGD